MVKRITARLEPKMLQSYTVTFNYSSTDTSDFVPTASVS